MEGDQRLGQEGGDGFDACGERAEVPNGKEPALHCGEHLPQGGWHPGVLPTREDSAPVKAQPTASETGFDRVEANSGRHTHSLFPKETQEEKNSDSFEEFIKYQQNSESHWLGCTGRQELIQELTEGSLIDSELDNTTLNRNRELLIQELGEFRFTLLMTKITKADIIRYQNDDPVLCRVKKYIQASSWPSRDELKRLF